MSKKAKFIALVNFKGGVGKSTLSSILASLFSSEKDNKKAAVLNIALGQSASSINEADTVDFAKVLEADETSTVSEVLASMYEDYDYVFIDTPGELSAELIEIIEHIDYFIIPFDKGRRVFEDTMACMDSIFTSGIIDRIDGEHNICLIYNKFNKIDDVLPRGEKFKEAIAQLKIPNNNKINLHYTSLSASDAVETMEDKKASIDTLAATNTVAYRIFNTKVKRMCDDVRKFIDSSK